jgi:hypothetical protein
MKQAGTDTSGKWMGVEHAEKFAELIVRECSIICKESGDVPAVLVSEDILLHFGVEE